MMSGADEGEASVLRPSTGSGVDLPRQLLRRFPLVTLQLWENGSYDEVEALLRAFSGWDRLSIRRVRATDQQAAEELQELRQAGVEYPTSPPQPCPDDLRDEWVEEVEDPPLSDEEQEEQAHR